MADLRYHVVATSFPIVYTAEGDHDPAGLLYTLSTSTPLLEWARKQWDWADEWLPRAHERFQRIDLLVDALDRYELMDGRLTGTCDADLLVYFGPAGGVVPDELPEEPDDLDDDPARRERRQHLHQTVDEAAGLLRILTGGAIAALSKTPAVRARWRAEWAATLPGLRAAIEARLEDIAKDWEVQRVALVNEITEAMVDRKLADRILNPATEADKRERMRLVRRMDRLVLNDQAETREGTLRYTRFHPLRPFDLVRPLVLRARRGDTVDVRVQNSISGRTVGFHRQGSGADGPGGDGVRFGDGAAVGENPETTIPPGQHRTFRWRAAHEGIWPVNDLADIRSSEAGTNVHGLFGAFVVLPRKTHWHDPETGDRLTGTDFADGLYVDVHRDNQTPQKADKTEEWVDFHHSGIPRGYREFTIVLHDEPEVHGALHRPAEPAVMPIAYRAEPLHNRLPHRMRQLVEETATRPLPESGKIDLHAVGREIDEHLAEVFWIGRRHDGTWVERVSGEEQHHSSWLFGDPATPILRAYAGDPARVQLVHAGVKETHVFHLHVHQWRDVPTDTAAPGLWKPDAPRGSQLIDSITIGPQHGFTIDPIYGSGSRQHAPGDIIWHCHLYPHFHHGMWGLWRSFDREVEAARLYSDKSICQPLKPLPGRQQKSDGRIGFPWFIDAAHPQKAPPPPARNDQEIGGRRRLLGMERACDAEKAAMVLGARPGALFVDLDTNARTWNERAKLPCGGRLIHVEAEVLAGDIVYNRRGWHDPLGHRYRVTSIQVDGGEAQHPIDPTPREPLFVRAHHGDVVELTLTNTLSSFPADHFDLAQLPVECGLHVHLVKFDVLAADGSSTGWNYLSGASCREAVPGVADTPMPAITSFHRWVVDEEFGPCFFHDHLLANYRQKRGLFAALVAEPAGSRWLEPDTPDLDPARPTAWTGTQAVVVPGSDDRLQFEAFREACLAVADFVPNFEPEPGRDPGRPLNPPGELSGDDDPGVMAVNYRSAPLTFRDKDPSRWFIGRDPDTGVIHTHPGDRLRIRLIQGSHEEQHSFVTHGLNWRREWQNPTSSLVGQQTLGISEAFTLDIAGQGGMRYGLGDHLWRFSGMDDLWLGCWGIVRAVPRRAARSPVAISAEPDPLTRPAPGAGGVREYTVRARRAEHRYDGDLLTDPYGLVYEMVRANTLVPAFAPGRRGGDWRLSTTKPATDPEPLVLRCHPGEWLRVTLVNEVLLAAERPPGTAGSTEAWLGPRFADPTLPAFGPEPHPPLLPLDDTPRRVSSRVSVHPSLLRYDVVSDDGAHVGRNRDGTVSPLPVRLTGEHDVPHPATGPLTGESTGEASGGLDTDPDGDPLILHRTDRTNVREYWWYADPRLMNGSPHGRVCYLHDMADIRNHRHHGLIGAVVVEPEGVALGATAPLGAAATLTAGGATVHERVVFWQDGLRLYLAGNTGAPVPDVEDHVDVEDSGQRGINYRSALLRSRPALRDDHPPTPVWASPAGEAVWLRLVGACDKPRNHTFTVHGVDWAIASWQGEEPRSGALSGLSAGTARDIVLQPAHPGDHAFRSGAFRWSVEQGMWGILRITRRSPLRWWWWWKSRHARRA